MILQHITTQKSKMQKCCKMTGYKIKMQNIQLPVYDSHVQHVVYLLHILYIILILTPFQEF
jgi:hypothetical protein